MKPPSGSIILVKRLTCCDNPFSDILIGYQLTMNPANRDDFLWLTSEQAQPVLRKVQKAFLEKVNAVRIAKSLRKKFSPSQSALVMEQAQLRIRAQRKFELADEMFFTRRGLEQASGKRIAKYKADHFVEMVNVADICCGIGADLIALSRRGSSDVPRTEGVPPMTVGLDHDPLTCLFARKNLEVNGISVESATVEEKEFESFSLEGFDGFHVDPDRRTAGRTVVGTRFSPSLTSVFESVGDSVNLAIKVAPATPAQDYFSDRLEREWIGDNRECKQQILWSGPFVKNPGHRTATYVGKRGVSSISIPESEVGVKDDPVDGIKKYIFEPHPSVLASRLTDALARKFELRRFTLPIVYLTGDHPVKDPLLSQFEVLEIVKLDLRATIKVLNYLGVGEVEIKRRGVDRVSASQFARMKLEGPNKATLILTRTETARVAVIAKRAKNTLTMPTGD